MATKTKTPATKYHFVITYNGKDSHNYLNYYLETNIFDFYFSITPNNRVFLEFDESGIFSYDKLSELNEIFNFIIDIQNWLDAEPKSLSEIIEEYYSDFISDSVWLEYKE